MLRPILFALVAFFALPAVAETGVTPPPGLEETLPPAPPPGGVSVSKDGRIVISSSVCPMLDPEPDVPGADYTPGVDAEGQPVAPADLPRAAPPLKLDNFAIEIDGNQLPVNSSLFQGKPIIGFVTIQDGRAYFNGQLIAENDEAMMRAACKAAGAR